MKNFSAQEVNNAYDNADQRVLVGAEQIDIDRIVANLRETYRLPLATLDQLRYSIDYTLIGLITARELTTVVRELFPENYAKIIRDLNEQVFQPILQYVRSHQPIILDDARQKAPAKDIFAEANIELEMGDIPTKPSRNEQTMMNIPKKPTQAPPQDRYREPIE